MDAKSFGARLRKLRVAAGFSSAEALARAFDPPLSGMTVGRWERGENKPDLDTIYKLADLLGVKPSAFFDEVAA